MLRRLAREEIVVERRDPVDTATLARAGEIIEKVRAGGEEALRALATELGDLSPGQPLIIAGNDLDAARTGVDSETLALLERTAARIADFADAQRRSAVDLKVSVPGGIAGHTVSAVERAGCYAPGGRYPLPSSVLMTAVTARTAGVPEVWVASPKPTPVTLAAAAVAGADAVLSVGGAQAIAALAYGAGPVPPCDVVVGPGNRWVTAAKKLVAGDVGIDMLAGPSELVVLADDSAEPTTVAADLLAQAEHDPDALPVLVSTSARLADAVDRELARQLDELPTRTTAAAAVENGFTVVAADLDEAVEVCNILAPEHLQVLTVDARAVAERLGHWGGLFIGATSAEVFGDYGVGPNHTLPTGGVARFKGGLSVLDFLRVRTWLVMEPGAGAGEMAADAAALARIEGLEAHARAAERRIRASRGTRR
ncbi:MAG: histidinol dehydrogenase [Thermoanaerobaculales bacterium]|jgi:phosphoribosyl-ATP pyrophosphohydrolase/phosphoribosyl-AMP cyclohydrolase/histidinol dehydrogenase|nr:histidinol dehydrogenase [Thermoanaerobaculales bacterium]